MFLPTAHQRHINHGQLLHGTEGSRKLCKSHTVLCIDQNRKGLTIFFSAIIWNAYYSIGPLDIIIE